MCNMITYLMDLHFKPDVVKIPVPIMLAITRTMAEASPSSLFKSLWVIFSGAILNRPERFPWSWFGYNETLKQQDGVSVW